MSQDQDLILPATVEVVVLDLPPLTEEQVDVPGVYVGVSNTDPDEPFDGAEVELSTLTDDGTGSGDTVDTLEISQSFKSEAVVGSVVGTCGGGVTGRFWDTATVLRVQLRRTTDDTSVFANETEEAVWAGKKNILAVGKEIIGFVTATPTGNLREWDLSKLSRGRRGTEQFIDSHSSAEQVVMLTGSSAIHFVPVSSDKVSPNVGAVDNLRARAVGGGLPITDATYTKTIPYEAKTLQQLPPTVLPAVRDATGNATISWLARSNRPFRLLSSVRDDRLTCCWCEEYEVEILNGARDTILRRFTVLNRRDFVYTAARQVTDFGSTQATIQVNIYKRAQLVGRGRTDGGAV